MSMMIILTEDEKNFILDYKMSFKNTLDKKRIDLNPILLNNNLYALSASLLNNNDFIEIKNSLENDGLLDNLTIRELTEDDYYEI